MILIRLVSGIGIWHVYLDWGIKGLPSPRRSGQIPVDDIGAIIGEPIHRMDINCGPVL